MLWLVTMASVPRHSVRPEQLGHTGWFELGCLAVAVLGGAIRPRAAGVIGVMVVVPGLVLSPWTTPRGDDDGLWLLIVPFLVVFTLVSFLAARLSARLARFIRPG